jgi:hypothetical protein
MFNANVDASDSVVHTSVPMAGTMTTLDVRINAAVNAGGSYTFFLHRNGVDTGLSCAISPAATSCTSAAVVALAAGDVVSIRAVPAGGPGGRTMRWTARFTP